MGLLVTVHGDKTSTVGEPKLRTVNLDGFLEWVGGWGRAEKKKKKAMNEFNL